MLNQWFGASRWVWNWALDARKKAYERRKQSITSVEISRRLTKLKTLPQYAWLAKPPATCLTQTLRDLDSAYSHFFRRVKSGETPGFPRFRSRHDNTVSLRFQDVSESGWARGVMKLPKLGAVKLAEKLPAVSCPDMVTLKREPDGRYYVTFSAAVEITPPRPPPPSDSAIGVDLGLTRLATLSNGERIENPRRLARRLRYLRQQQRCLARRQKGSKRYEKQRLRVARAYRKVADQRNYALHALTTRLIREYQIICIEDLSVRNMMQHPRLARHIADAGWGEVRRQLEYKARWYGRTLVVVDRWFPSSKTCPSCGHRLEELRLDVRRWACPKCGREHDRDLAAAQNLLTAGLRQLALREAGDLRVEAAEANAAGEARTGRIN